MRKKIPALMIIVLLILVLCSSAYPFAIARSVNGGGESGNTPINSGPHLEIIKGIVEKQEVIIAEGASIEIAKKNLAAKKKEFLQKNNAQELSISDLFIDTGAFKSYFVIGIILKYYTR